MLAEVSSRYTTFERSTLPGSRSTRTGLAKIATSRARIRPRRTQRTGLRAGLRGEPQIARARTNNATATNASTAACVQVSGESRWKVVCVSMFVDGTVMASVWTTWRNARTVCFS